LNARHARNAGLFARLAATSLFLPLSQGVSLAGPPRRADDPESVDYGQREFDSFATDARLGGGAYGFAPACNIHRFQQGRPNGQSELKVG
jgi:hypothetical protein